MASQERTFGNLDTRELARRDYLLLGDFWRQDKELGLIVAKKGFRTNYASIDILLKTGLIFFYAFLASYGDQSATIHDWLYSGYGIERPNGSIYYPTRRECDEAFHRALLDEGVGPIRAMLFFIGVRIGGAAHFVDVPVTFVPQAILEA